MVLEAERWLELRRFRTLRESGASISEIARETGLNWRTVRKYLEHEGPVAPPTAAARPSRRNQMIDAYAPVIDAWLRAELLLKGTVIHERLVEEYGFTGNYQRVKLYLQQARPRIAAELGYSPNELARLHRRFEVVPGAQAQVDWGDEGAILAHVGIVKVYSFHMVLSYSRDPFCCFTTSQDLATFWACHRRAFEHFGGVPGSIVYDRTKTVVRRHVAPGKAVPLHPEAVAFAGHYDFDIDVLAAYRPTGKGRVERQVSIVRDHVLAGRSFASLDDLDNAFLAWVPLRRRLTHRTHGEVIGVRARRDHAALRPIPSRPYIVANRHLRHVGKDCLVAFEANLYSVPATKVVPRQLVEVRASSATVSLHTTVPDEQGITLLAVHPRAVGRGARVVDPEHWRALPDGHTRATTTSGENHMAPADELTARRAGHEPTGALRFLLARADAANVKVGRRPLSVYDQITGTGPFS
ncbi:IS21 family transposase [Nonomuraea wenchangensis]|uniref:Transposase n=1 Tax=Nonomuraea wenchangensis TaxID=568860 RepID=A0A1I0LUW9_9ACTN|nr:IS21 family transposase [Nonomuraea wenchangensis]SEU47417.1 Transposase [Nonomuraea wenchangensis]